MTAVNNFLNKKWFLFLVFLIFTVIVYYFYIHFQLYDKVTLKNLQSSHDFLKRYVSEHYLLSVGIYISTYLVFTVLFIPSADILSLAGGYLFGFICILYINIAVTIGDALSFLLVRYFIGQSVQKRFEKYLILLNHQIEQHGYQYFLTLRLIPVIPFFMINILAGFTKVPLRTYLWTTSLGIIPGSIVYIYAGRSLQSIQSVKDIISPQIIIAFTFVALLSFLPHLIMRKIKGVNVISKT